MRIQMRSGILAVLAVAVLAVSAAAATAPVNSMGIVLNANNASLNGSTAVNRATIFSGDMLATQNAGELRALFGSSQVYLFANSMLSVSQVGDGLSAELTGGSVLLTSGEGQTFRVMADGVVVQPKGNGHSVAQISFVSPTELMLTSRQGDLELTMGDETQTVAQGNSYRVTIKSPSQPASPASPAPIASGGGSTAFFVVALVIVGTGTGVALWRAFESSSSN